MHEHTRVRWVSRWLQDGRQDLRYGIRTLMRTPGFSVLAILTLTLGIGSVTIIYSVIHSVLLEPLPYPGSDRFVNVRIVDTDTQRGRTTLPPSEFLDLQEQSTVFDAVFGTRGDSAVLRSADSAVLLRTVQVTPNFFPVMGLSPLFGRALDEHDAASDAAAVAVLRYRAWVTHFASDPDVVGRVIDLGGVQRTIVGVMPPRFTWHAADVWIPGPILREQAAGDSSLRNFQGRLRTGVTLQEAEAQLNVLIQRRAELHPAEYPGRPRVMVVNVIDQVVGDFRGVLYTALAAVALLLLIACCNVANMLLARASAREREMTIRGALGAGHGRIVRQVLAESLLLGLSGAAGGVLLTYVGIRALVPFLPQGPLPGEVAFGLDSAALLFSVAVATIAAILFGIAPALYSTRRDLVEALKGGGRGLTAGSGRLRQTLVVAGIALSLVLVLGAGLLLRSFLALVNVDLGFDPQRILVRQVTFPRDAYRTPAERQQLYTATLQRIVAIPGVVGAAASTGIPPFGSGYMSEIEVAGKPADPQRTALVQACTSGYFQVLGVPFLRGQPFSDASAEHLPRQAVVSDTLATSYFGLADPVGQQITISIPGAVAGQRSRLALQVVGVVGDVRNRGPREPVAPHVYLSGPALVGNPAILVRTSGKPAALANALRDSIRTTNRYVIVGEPGTIEEILGAVLYAQPRFSLLVISLFAVAGTLLVAIGVFSVIAYMVSRQTREIAVRIALGASRGHVMRVVLRSAGQLLVVGVIAGLFASFAATRILAHQLEGISPHDPASIIAAVAIVTFTVVLACYLPVRRAVRIDPMAALRLE